MALKQDWSNLFHSKLVTHYIKKHIITGEFNPSILLFNNQKKQLTELRKAEVFSEYNKTDYTSCFKIFHFYITTRIQLYSHLLYAFNVIKLYESHCDIQNTCSISP